jgi:hypothetical protein
MKKYIIISILIFVFITVSCSKDEDNNNGGNNTITVENTNRTIANLNTNFFKPTKTSIKGIVLLGSGNNAQDPTEGNITDGYLVSMAQEYAKLGFITAIVAYRDQPNVGPNFINFNSNAEMLITDFNNVGNALRTEFNIPRNKLVFGGVSYTANVLISKNAYGANAQDIKGIVAIMGSCAEDAAKDQKLPILAYACKDEPFGTHYGNILTNAITNTTIKSKSFGLTDSSCSGHNTAVNWVADSAQKLNDWFN